MSIEHRAAVATGLITAAALIARYIGRPLADALRWLWRRSPAGRVTVELRNLRDDLAEQRAEVKALRADVAAMHADVRRRDQQLEAEQARQAELVDRLLEHSLAIASYATGRRRPHVDGAVTPLRRADDPAT